MRCCSSVGTKISSIRGSVAVVNKVGRRKGWCHGCHKSSGERSRYFCGKSTSSKCRWSLRDG